LEQQLERKRRIALESNKTKRAREKLRREWGRQEKLITPEALAETVEKIHQWIASHAAQRVSVLSKEIKLFDQNKNAAALSKKVERFALSLSKSYS
jgi:hypothetical protein